VAGLQPDNTGEEAYGVRNVSKRLITNGAVTGTGGGVSDKGAVTIPDNFWGFVMLVMGMR